MMQTAEAPRKKMIRRSSRRARATNISFRLGLHSEELYAARQLSAP